MNVGLKLATLNGVTMNLANKWLNDPSQWTPETPFQLHWIAIKEACRKEKVEFNESFEEFIDMIEEDPELLTAIINIQSESQPVVDQKKTSPVAANKRK